MMKNQIKEYKIKLEDLSNSLKKYDGNKADSDFRKLKKLFDEVYKSGVLDILQFPKEQIDLFKLELFELLSKTSGTLSFLVIQILAANSIINKNDYRKKEYYLKKKCGVAINHLRAPFTVVDAIKCDGGYKLNGTLTWASGYKIFDTLLIGFHCDNKEYEAMSSFSFQEGFEIGQADETFVGYGLNTVNIELKNYFVKQEDIVSSKPMGHYTKQKSISKTVHFCLYGLGVCALENCSDSEVFTVAKKKLKLLKTKFLSSDDPKLLDKLRVELFLFVQQIVTTAMALKGGSSVLASQNLQRVYRELIMFNSNGLNDTLKGLFKEKFLDV